jgi:hypothetical protein
MNKLEKQALLDPDRYDRDKYVGDGFEFLVEIFIHTTQYDNRLGITEYIPIQTNDNGVDGVGVNLAGDKCVVQIKYRSNNQSFLTATKDHLDSMFTEGMISHDVVIPKVAESVPRHYVITTASGLHHYTDNEKFKGYVKCLGYDDLRAMLDDNLSFWNLCRKIASEFCPVSASPSKVKYTKKVVKK